MKTNDEIKFDDNFDYPEKLICIKDICYEHATDLLTAAKTVIEKNDLPNVAYHLATLALEEIGRANILKLKPFVIESEDEENNWIEKNTEDHVKKIYWAIFDVFWGQQVIDKEKLDAFTGLAQRIHNTRKKGIYVDVTETEAIPPKEKINRDEALNLIDLVENTLQSSKHNSKIRKLNEPEKETVKWFLEITNDANKRKFITSAGSQTKLVELGDVGQWFVWLKQQFDEADAKSKEWAKEEINNVISIDDSDKWRLRVRLFTNSYTIKQKTLNWFNSLDSYVKLYVVDKNKNALDVEYILPKSVHVGHLYWAGWGFIRKFVTALNIGSLGYFWWYVPEQTSKYYIKLTDIEKNCEIIVERNPALKINWERDKLTEQDIRNAALCIGMIPKANEKEKIEPFNLYLTGLMFLSKNDIHFQFEIDAYRCFFQSLQEGTKIYEPMSVDDSYEATFKRVISNIAPKFDEVEKYYNIGKEIQERKIRNDSITLEDVFKMKALCDIYFLTTFRKIHKENEDLSQRKAHQG